MAITRQVLDSVNFVLPSDDAIDSAGTDYDAYIRSGYDAKHLQLKEGRSFTVFKLAQLRHKQTTYAESLSAGERREFIVRAGLRSVDGLKMVDDQGRELPVPPIRFRDETELGRLIDPKWLDDVNLGSRNLEWLELAIVGISEVGLPLSTRSGGQSGAGA